MDELTQEQITFLRRKVRGYMQQGVSLSTINAQLKAQHGISTDELMKFSGNDFARAFGQGITLNHLDELAGAVAKTRGKDYTAARDAVRNNDAESSAANPKLNALYKILGGAIPGMVAGGVPGLAMAPEAGMVTNALRGAAQGALTGGVAGAGSSTAPTAGGVVGDAFSLPTALSAILGGLGGATVSKIASRGLPQTGAGRVSQEGAALLPNKSPDDIRWTVARQEQLAPSTAVAADLSPEFQTLARGVGADRKAAMQATIAAESRYRDLVRATREVGRQYDVLKGQTAPVDPDLLVAIAATGRKGVIPAKLRPGGGEPEADLANIHDLRSDLVSKAKAAAASKDKKLAYDLRQQAGALTVWLQKQWPAIKGVDSDFAFLNERADAALRTMKILKRSQASYGSNRAFGVESGSVGGSLPLPGGSVGVVIKQVAKQILSPSDRAARARQVVAQFLTPIRGTNLLDHLLDVHGVLTQPADHSALNATRSAIFGGMAPVGTNLLFGQRQ